MKFPVATIPTFFGLSKLTIHIGLMIITLIIYSLFGYPPDLYTLQIPILMLFMLLFFIAWALFASMLSCMSQDFLHLVRSFTTALFWLSGIMWDTNKIHTQWVQTVLMFNPVTYFSWGYREAMVYKHWLWEYPKHFFFFCITLLVVFVLAIWAYNKLKKEIPDVLS
jgi:teichoic acid transport system permease protein